MSLGSNCRGIRNAKHLTQRELAKRGRFALAFIQYIEQGRIARIDPAALTKLAGVLESDQIWLASGQLPLGQSFSRQASVMSLEICAQKTGMEVDLREILSSVAARGIKFPLWVDQWESLIREYRLGNLSQVSRRKYGL